MTKAGVTALALLLTPAIAFAQQPAPLEMRPLPPLGTPVPPPPAAIASGPAPAAAPPVLGPSERVFCEQPVTIRLASPSAVADRYRPFIGIFSDASWTPSLCAALIVESVAPDGTATILYVFGPMGANLRGPSGVLRGTGIIRDGELRFQNTDGSQFAFRPIYADLNGHVTTPQGQNLEAIFKKTP